MEFWRILFVLWEISNYYNWKRNNTVRYEESTKSTEDLQKFNLRRFRFRDGSKIHHLLIIERGMMPVVQVRKSRKKVKEKGEPSTSENIADALYY